MKSKTPIGLKILTVMVLLANLGAIQSLFDSNATIIVGNFFFTGISVKLYYAVMIPLGIVTAYGLWTLKRWGLILFLAGNAADLLILAVSLLFTTEETLLSAGWQPHAKIINIFQAMHMFGIIFILCITAWALAYRKHFVKRCTTQTKQLVKTGPYQVSATAQPGRGLQNNINTAADRAADTRDRSPALRSER